MECIKHFFSQDSPSSNCAQPEKVRPERNTSQAPENSRPNANAAEKGARQTTRHPAWQRRLQQPPNQRTNQLGAAQPPPGKPTESGRKDMHCTHEGQKAEKRGPNLLHKGPEEGTEPKRCQAAEARNTPAATQPTLPRRKPSKSVNGLLAPGVGD